MSARSPANQRDGRSAKRKRGSAQPQEIDRPTAHQPFRVAFSAVSYGSGRGPKSGGGTRCFVAASYAEARRKSIGSEKGRPKNIIPTGSFAGTGPDRREPPGAAASRTRSYTWVVKPAGTDRVGMPCCPNSPQTEFVLPFNGGSIGAPKI